MLTVWSFSYGFGSGRLLGLSWDLLGPSCGPLGGSWRLLGGLLGLSWATWAPLGASWGLLGSLLLLGASKWLLARPWEPLGPRCVILGASWGLLGTPWGPLGTSWVGDLSQGQNFIVGNEVLVLSENGCGIVGVMQLNFCACSGRFLRTSFLEMKFLLLSEVALFPCCPCGDVFSVLCSLFYVLFFFLC